MLLGNLVAGFLANMLTCKGIIRPGDGVAHSGKMFWFCLIFFLILKLDLDEYDDAGTHRVDIYVKMIKWHIFLDYVLNTFLRKLRGS